MLAQVNQEEACVAPTAETTAPGLEGITADLDWCDCENDLSGGLGSAVQASTFLQASVNQLTSVSTTPDVAQDVLCNTNCCSCNEANGE